MTWLVFGISCLLVLAGAVSVTSGAPIIQLERGWAEVIAGSVAISGGAVVFALGVILMRLEALRDAVAATVVSPVATMLPDVIADEAPAPAAVEQTTAEPVVPEPVTPEPVGAAQVPPEPPAEATASDQGLWKRIRRPVTTTVAADTPEPEKAPVSTSMDASDALAQEPVAQEAVAQDRPSVEPPALRAIDGTRSPASSEGEAGQLGWLDRSLFGHRAPKPAGASRIEPSLSDTPAHSVPLPDAPRVEPEPPVYGSTTEDAPPVAADDGPTVIGRYQAGVASYVMYSDGTIEVETEGGQSHRFGSMDELKAYIADQDKAAI